LAEPRISRTEWAYRHLIEEILRGRWASGETLSTYALAEELHVSRTPVLEALKRLENEGLVEIIPQVGCRVVGPSAVALEGLFALRGAVEGLAAEAAARRIGPDELSELEALLHRLEAAGEREDRAAPDQLDVGFHLRIAEIGAVPHLVQSARSVWSALRYQLARLAVESEPPRETVAEHGEIYEALRRRAPKRARAAAERHAALSGARHVGALEPAGGLSHGALVYGAEEEYLAVTAPFVGDGIDRDERVLAVTTPRNVELLTGALGRRAEAIEFRDSHEFYCSPSHTLLAYERYVDLADGDRVRIVGEPVWDGLSTAAMTEWTRYEAILNVEFARSAVSFLCPYDTRVLPAAIVAQAGRTHPDVHSADGVAPSGQFTDMRTLSAELDHVAFDEPHGPVMEHPVTRDLHGIRDFAIEQAHRAGVAPKRVLDALLAVQEVAANVVAHGPGTGTARAWTNNGQLIYEVSDDGPGLADPLTAHLTLDPALRGAPRGLWIARLLCDLVEVRSAGAGLTVRLHITADETLGPTGPTGQGFGGGEGAG
jgi:DNA-binding GntR family transcriptional regulator/anti-sigma regulatory factor (Ser/Thr protein kinase)